MIGFQVNDSTTAVMMLIDSIKYDLSCPLMKSLREILHFPGKKTPLLFNY